MVCCVNSGEKSTVGGVAGNADELLGVGTLHLAVESLDWVSEVNMSDAVVAITRNGLGDLWSFETVQDVWDHALIQYGDVVLERKEDILRMYMPHEVLPFAQRICEDEEALVRVEQMLRTGLTDSALSILWAGVRRLARPAPTDPAFICNQVRIDRRTPTDRSSRGKTMDTTTTEAPKAKEPKAPKYSPTAKITMGKDKDGKSYGADNNPKRAGSASATRFAAYKSGMTVEAALAAGITTADLDHDSKKGFISVG